MTDDTLARLSSRKFILAVLAILVAAGLCWFGRIDGAGFVTVALAAMAGYMAANVAQKKVEADGK
jgi:hypothetical protein